MQTSQRTPPLTASPSEFSADASEDVLNGFKLRAYSLCRVTRYGISFLEDIYELSLMACIADGAKRQPDLVGGQPTPLMPA